MSRHDATSSGGEGATAVAALAAQRWVPVLRCADDLDATATALACREGGIDIVELTCSTPRVSVAVRRLVDEGMTVGVGTVRTPTEVEQVASAGASFVVSFHRPTGFVAAAAVAGVPAIPGALSPHEVAAAIDDGAAAVKLFPARVLVPAYLSDLLAVLGPVPIMVTGGISTDPAAMRAWLDAGAFCVGVGSALGTAAGVGAEEVARRTAAICGGLVAP